MTIFKTYRSTQTAISIFNSPFIHIILGLYLIPNAKIVYTDEITPRNAACKIEHPIEYFHQMLTNVLL